MLEYSIRYKEIGEGFFIEVSVLRKVRWRLFMTYVPTELKKEISIEKIVTIHYFEYMKEFEFRGESHDFWEFLYVDQGTVIVWADSKEYQLKSGNIIFHKPNEFHAIKSVGHKAPNLVAISFLCDSDAMRHFDEKVTSLNSQEKTLIAKIVAEARVAFTTPLHVPTVEQVLPALDPPFGSQQMILLYLEEFLVLVQRNHPRSSRDGSYTEEIVKRSICEENSRKVYSFSRIITYMELHICEPLKVRDICNAFYISSSTLQSLFHDQKGCGVIEYFHQMKIEHSKDIIRDGSMNLTEIAHYLGYNSLQHFSKRFKTVTGMSPFHYASSVKGLSQGIGGNS